MEHNTVSSFMSDFYAISNKLNQIRNTPVKFSGGVSVNSAGLSLIYAVATNPGANMSEIGTVLGLTKGAVSQMVTKLQAKGLIEKLQGKDSGKNVMLMLTDEGRRINNEQLVIRRKMAVGIENIVKKYSDSDIELIRGFLCEIGNFMEKYQHEIGNR